MSSEVAKKEPKKFEPSPSFAKNLYVGKLEPAQVFPYPNPLSNEQKETVSMLTDPFEKFFQVKTD